MAEARPRLALVDRAIAEQPEDTEAKNHALRRILAKHTPVIAKLVRQDVTAELTQKAGVGLIEEISALPHLRASFEREEAKHVRGAFGWGALWGALGGLVLGASLSLLVAIGYGRTAFENAQQATQQGALIGAAAANQDPNRRTHDAPYQHGAREPGDAPGGQ